MNYKLFGTQTGLPASQLIMGGSQLGNRRGQGTSVAEALTILAAYAEGGGNFIDVSDLYQFGQAETIVGEFIQDKRPDFILCTKYTLSSQVNAPVANVGNHRKAMRQAVDASLKRLKTDYIDLYMPHFDDGHTPLEEIARGLEDLVKAGKIIYTGLANFPAWKAALIASSIPLAAIQFEYNLAQRAADRELKPMAEHMGLAIMGYSPLAGGLLTAKYRRGDSGRLSNLTSYQEDEATTSILDILEHIALELGTTPGPVALAWTLRQGLFPIIGARTLAQLQTSFQAIGLSLSPDQLSRLDQVSRVAKGYPHELLASVQKK
ncbi:oxidoreductase [Siphonobacter sp. BAB-5405]|uniref:aldo/keto reductase n=1 Tax=Siphonobacter sp. BAB-5405 TaxID=1864825 RepID=UPI000C80368E|nr:aldo/keto reductase [Siphonobacter sp. BAB-5405]PMD90789.1 oxidoreductase [Siphonobacter sp. BAB-5405]